MSADKPAYRDRYPCQSCGTGYLDCASGRTLYLMCCKDCAHPDRRTTQPPYTEAEINDMWRRAERPRP